MRHIIVLVFLFWGGLVHAGALTVEDRRGAQRFDSSPERIAVLDWALAQQVLDLDVVPVAMPEIALYRDWVAEPAIPPEVIDIGRRGAPDLERLAALGPDVILVSDVAPADVARLERIAPVLVFDTFDASHDNIAAAQRIYLMLARLFDREALALARLDAMAREIEHLADDLRHRRFRQVAIIRLNDAATIWVYGENSFAVAALERLGLENALPQPPSRWGVAQRPLDTLAEVTDGALLAIRPHGPGAEVFDSPVWRFLPAVAQDRFAEMPPLWSYGGILTLGRHARAISAALISLAP
ncbi:iron complex transport system substrate-binding protein [Roseovarius azorensis]|uniref:Iron complex transport system substrate-binding protein n=1 Tax=Roseovarius azorensis TaxID=1287727 RepID=A0A1H7LZN5_9RHOB|nr:ABC transporter substrate-binding protein [Roseovarius azorensis]SEL04394.1 iron complex transport system substrate-binding protein [Roseovarius azorensis]